MKDDSRPFFADPSKPLNCGRADVHVEIAERIKAAKKAARLYNKVLAKEWGCEPQTVGNRLRKPEDRNLYEVDTLCRHLRVSLDYLRYGGDNGYGRYESDEFMADVIRQLDADQKETVWRVIKYVAGSDLISDVRRRRRKVEYMEWMERHPEEVKALTPQLSGIIELLGDYVAENPVGGCAAEASKENDR